MAQTILTQRQQKLLTFFSSQPYICDNFFLSGGTALAEYYLHHRLSEDLDFFSLKEVEVQILRSSIAKSKSLLHFQKVTFENSFNRNLFFLHFPEEVIKMEFTYYPFEQIERPKIIGNLKIDSLLDIAVNKADTIRMNPRTRDFIDLYAILEKTEWTVEQLMKDARIKFDVYVDPLQQAENFLKVSHVKDYPRMLIPFDFKKCEEFWIEEARKLKKEIIV